MHIPVRSADVCKGWRPAGEFSLGRFGLPINVAALVYGVLAMILLAWPRFELEGVNRYLPLLGVLVVLGSGAAYLALARPDRNSTGPQSDAIAIAQRLRAAAGAGTQGRTGPVAADTGRDGGHPNQPDPQSTNQ